MPAEWKNIETAPKDQTEVLLYFPSDGNVVPGYRDGDCWANALDGDLAQRFADDPTHWMPLPGPPV